MDTIENLSTPQLKKLHSGKVRDSFRVDAKRRLIVVTDRVSAFDKKLSPAIPHKGAVLNTLSGAWFTKTRHIIENHLIDIIDPNISLVKEASPIAVEMIVRKFLTGSIWREYAKGKRTFSGVTLPDGLDKNDPFPTPIITPTTKDIIDEEITPEAIVSRGLVDKETYDLMAQKSLELFQFGYDLCASKDLLLVDTKYEFGTVDGELILIDEIHTPDSSRFWDAQSYEKDPKAVASHDKEFLRQWILNNEKGNKDFSVIPEEVVENLSQIYQRTYKLLLSEELPTSSLPSETRIYNNLLSSNLIKDSYVVVILASKRDFKHGEKIVKELGSYGVMVDVRVVSAHKNGEDIPHMLADYNHSIEPGAIIAVAGRSNGLGGALSANATIPVINCPPFSDKTDLLLNINSSLVMPTNASAATCIDPSNAARAALRALNTPRVRKLFREEIAEVKRALQQEDNETRERFHNEKQLTLSGGLV